MKCNRCSATVDDNTSFCPNCGNNVKQQTTNVQQAQAQQVQSAQSQNTGAAAPPKPNNNLVICIIGLLCCWPISLVGLLKAVKVDTLYSQGLYAEAEAAAADAKKWGIIGIVTGVVINLVAIIFYVIVMAASLGGNF